MLISSLCKNFQNHIRVFGDRFRVFAKSLVNFRETVHVSPDPAPSCFTCVLWESCEITNSTSPCCDEGVARAVFSRTRPPLARCGHAHRVSPPRDRRISLLRNGAMPICSRYLLFRFWCAFGVVEFRCFIIFWWIESSAFFHDLLLITFSHFIMPWFYLRLFYSFVGDFIAYTPGRIDIILFLIYFQ